MNVGFNFNSNLRIMPMGGVDNVTKNMFIYEFGNDIIVVDCGIGFPDKPGGKEELTLPDFSYLLKNQYRIRGLFVTHAHFDHYGAVPHLIQKLNIPIYTSRLTQEFIKKDLEEFKIKEKYVDFQLLRPQDIDIKLGAFTVTPFHINHSVPEALGLFIKTPIGNVFHVADYKFDWTPVDEEPFDMQKLTMLANFRKPTLLLSDCLGAEKSGHTESEATIREVFENLVLRAKGLVLFTTVSSNIMRMKEAVIASANLGRKTALLGRSVEESGKIASMLGYFSDIKQHLMPSNKIKHYPRHKLSVIVAGSYGQTDSALTNIAANKHQFLRLKPNDMVIFSADPSPPAVIGNVNDVLDNLSKLGVKVYYNKIQDDLHVSGHGTAEDIKMLVRLINPKYLMPIGGNFRHMIAYANLANQMGYQDKNILLLNDRQSLEINSKEEIIVR